MLAQGRSFVRGTLSRFCRRVDRRLAHDFGHSTNAAIRSAVETLVAPIRANKRYYSAAGVSRRVLYHLARRARDGRCGLTGSGGTSPVKPRSRAQTIAALRRCTSIFW
jgi:hypothetical protein